MTMKEFALQYKSAFLRIHKTYLVNKDKVNSLDGNRLHVQGDKLPISSSYKVMVQDFFENRQK